MWTHCVYICEIHNPLLIQSKETSPSFPIIFHSFLHFLIISFISPKAFVLAAHLSQDNNPRCAKAITVSIMQPVGDLARKVKLTGAKSDASENVKSKCLKIILRLLLLLHFFCISKNILLVYLPEHIKIIL